MEQVEWVSAPGRRVHPADSPDDVQLEKTICHNSGGRGRSTEELGSLVV